MTLSRYLPTTAKHMEKARPKPDFGNILLPNKPVVVNRALPQSSTTITTMQQQEQGRPGYLNEEHECYKDIELEALRKENAELKEKNEMLFQTAKKGIRIT
jgi:hypothetical protein